MRGGNAHTSLMPMGMLGDQGPHTDFWAFRTISFGFQSIKKPTSYESKAASIAGDCVTSEEKEYI